MPITDAQLQALRPVFFGNRTLGNGMARPVYLGERDLKIGDLIYRGCTATSQEEAVAMLDEPRFFSITPSGARPYCNPMKGDPPGRIGFLIISKLIRPICLSNVSLYPIVQAATSSATQEWQRLNSTDVARRLLNEQIDGIWDHDGDEILIEFPAHVSAVNRILKI